MKPFRITPARGRMFLTCRGIRGYITPEFAMKWDGELLQKSLIHEQRGWGIELTGRGIRALVKGEDTIRPEEWMQKKWSVAVIFNGSEVHGVAMLCDVEFNHQQRRLMSAEMIGYGRPEMKKN